jgi:organic hydroperoxide reductase OsmC/OhrA
MNRVHTYETLTTWTGDLGSGTSDYRSYGRDHETVAVGRPAIAGSADPIFRGDPMRWNPELLLVASLSQCHMLWYLGLCSAADVVVVEYRDDAIGEMEETADGDGRFTSVILRPNVVVAADHMHDAALSLHHEASARCFIASSVNFPVRHEPAVSVRVDAP